MAIITQITYGRTFNNGNYESSRIEIAAEVGDDNHLDAMVQLGKEMERLRSLDIAIRSHDKGLDVDPKIGRIHKK